MSVNRALVVLAVLVCSCIGAVDPEAERTEAAFALGDHKQISRDACRAVGLPRDVCTRVALEDRNTDAGDEQSDPATHAHGPAGLGMCESANLVLARMAMLGEEYRAALDALRSQTPARRSTEEELVGDLLDVVGRALHTYEDNFAHAGVQNPQHAWFTLQDMCEGTDDSPDARPGAAEAAAEAITVVLMGLKDDLAALGKVEWVGYRSCPQVGERPQVSTSRCAFRKTPSLSAIRDFLGEARDWDGIDRQWNPAVMSEAIRDAYLRGVVRDMCEEPPLLADPADPVDTGGGPAHCFASDLVCLGRC